MVADEAEAGDGLARDMIDVLTGMCARLHNRRSALRKAERAARLSVGERD